MLFAKKHNCFKHRATNLTTCFRTAAVEGHQFLLEMKQLVAVSLQIQNNLMYTISCFILKGCHGVTVFRSLQLRVLLAVAGTNGLRFLHSLASESTSTAQVNLPLLINGKHAEKQNHAMVLSSFAVLFLHTKFAIVSKPQKMQKNPFAVFAYFSHSVVLKSSTSLF